MYGNPRRSRGFVSSSCTSNTCILAYNLFWCLQPQQTIYFKIFSGSAHFRRDPFIILRDGWVILGKKEKITGKHSKGAFEISVFGFSFLPFDWEIRKRVWKTVLKNSGLERARILSKKKTTVHENSFAKPFSDFPIEIEIRI